MLNLSRFCGVAVSALAAITLSACTLTVNAGEEETTPTQAAGSTPVSSATASNGFQFKVPEAPTDGCLTEFSAGASTVQSGCTFQPQTSGDYVIFAACDAAPAEMLQYVVTVDGVQESSGEFGYGAPIMSSAFTGAKGKEVQLQISSSQIQMNAYAMIRPA